MIASSDPEGLLLLLSGPFAGHAVESLRQSHPALVIVDSGEGSWKVSGPEAAIQDACNALEVTWGANLSVGHTAAAPEPGRASAPDLQPVEVLPTRPVPAAAPQDGAVVVEFSAENPKAARVAAVRFLEHLGAAGESEDTFDGARVTVPALPQVHEVAAAAVDRTDVLFSVV